MYDSNSFSHFLNPSSKVFMPRAYHLAMVIRVIITDTQHADLCQASSQSLIAVNLLKPHNNLVRKVPKKKKKYPI